MRLDIHRLETEFGEPRLVVRHKGKTRHGAQQAEIAASRFKREGDAPELRRALLDVGAIAETSLTQALGGEPP